MRKFFVFAAIAAVCGVAVSCSDDENAEEPGGGNNGSSTPVVPETSPSDFGGVRLMSVIDSYGYGTDFSYDANNLIKKITDGSSAVTFDFSKGTATFSESGFEQVANITNTKSGLITSVQVSDVDYEESEQFTEDIKWDFQYDSGDHLVKASYVYRCKNAAGREVESETVTVTFTWNGNLLSSSNLVGVENYETGDVDNWSKSVTFEYDDALTNRYMQYTGGMISAIDLDVDVESCMFVGLLGRGSSQLPSKIIAVSSSNHREEEEYNYTIGNNGLIEVESATTVAEYGTYSWSNTYIYSDTHNPQSKVLKAPKADKKHRFFRRAEHTRKF